MNPKYFNLSYEQISLQCHLDECDFVTQNSQCSIQESQENYRRRNRRRLHMVLYGQRIIDNWWKIKRNRNTAFEQIFSSTIQSNWQNMQIQLSGKTIRVACTMNWSTKITHEVLYFYLWNGKNFGMGISKLRTIKYPLKIQKLKLLVKFICGIGNYNNQYNKKVATMRVKNSNAILGAPLTIPVVAVCVVLAWVVVSALELVRALVVVWSRGGRLGGCFGCGEWRRCGSSCRWFCREWSCCLNIRHTFQIFHLLAFKEFAFGEPFAFFFVWLK